MLRPLILALALALGLSGCDRSTPPRPSAQNATSYEVRGVVQKVDAVRGSAVIAHETIPGYMEAMTMEFTAARATDLEAVQPGDALTFRLTVTDAHSRIDQIRKTGTAPITASSSESAGPAPGTPLPDLALVDQSGRAFRLADLRGKTVALTFIFTRCPLPDYCPRLTGHFGTVQRELVAAHPDGKWHLLSITIDPAHDTPERLAQYAARHQADPAHWTFATGESAVLSQLASVFGLAVTSEGAALNHNLRTAIIDREGRVQKVFAGNQWTPHELATELRRSP
jgi:protein SCO1